MRAYIAGCAGRAADLNGACVSVREPGRHRTHAWVALHSSGEWLHIRLENLITEEDVSRVRMGTGPACPRASQFVASRDDMLRRRCQQRSSVFREAELGQDELSLVFSQLCFSDLM